MKRSCWVSALPFMFLLASNALSGADLSTYRGFQFGMTLGSALKHSGMDPSEVKSVRQRPALIQEFIWSPARFAARNEQVDPVQEVLFSFYNGQLSKLVVDYDEQKTEGMTGEDFIQATSAQYGPATYPSKPVSLPSTSFSEGVTVLARWENGDNLLTLVQSPYGSKFSLIAVSKKLDGLTQAAVASGTRLDEEEAPQRLKAEQQHTQDNLEKARLASVARFHP